MSRLPIISHLPTGDRVYLDTIGQVQAVRYQTSVNGDLAATWEMRLDPRTDHRALQPGRSVRIPYGASKGWAGFLGNPRRGDVWECNASGRPWYLQRYGAIASTTANALKLDEVIDEVIARGAPFTRPSALPSLTDGSIASGFIRATDALNSVCDAKNQIWQVDRHGQVTSAGRSTTTAYLLQSTDTAGGRTVLGFVTDVHVTYLNKSNYATTTILRSALSRPYGRFEDVLDLTPKGPISTGQAQDEGDNWLAKRGPRLRFTAPFVVTPGQLLTPGGQPVDLATVQATDGCLRVMLTDPDSAAGELTVGSVKVPMGETDYDVDADLLNITPLDHTPAGMQAVFA